MELNVNIRGSQKARQLIKEGLVPAIIYGKHLKDPIVVSCIKNDFLKRYKEAGYSTPLTIKGKDIDQLVLIQDMQVDPVTNNLIHVDFLAVSKDEKVKTEISVVLTGESPIEKIGEGKIQLIKDFIEVEAFPQDLPHNFMIDISVIQTMNDTIFVKDIKVSDKVTILDDLEQPIVTVVKLAEEEVEEKPVVAAEGAVAEGAAAEGAEGAVPAEGDKVEKGKEGDKAEKGKEDKKDKK